MGYQFVYLFVLITISCHNSAYTRVSFCCPCILCCCCRCTCRCCSGSAALAQNHDAWCECPVPRSNTSNDVLAMSCYDTTPSFRHAALSLTATMSTDAVAPGHDACVNIISACHTHLQSLLHSTKVSSASEAPLPGMQHVLLRRSYHTQ